MIARTFGLKSICYRLAPGLVSSLRPEVVKAFEQDVIGKMCALELVLVVPERQIEILGEMKTAGDYSPALCRSLIIQTPMERRNNKRRQRRTWVGDNERRKDMVVSLASAW